MNQHVCINAFESIHPTAPCLEAPTPIRMIQNQKREGGRGSEEPRRNFQINVKSYRGLIYFRISQVTSVQIEYSPCARILF